MKKILILFVPLFFLTGCSSQEEAQVGSSVELKDYNITVTDYYYADFFKDEEELPLEFDDYLAVDLKFANTSDEDIVIKTLNSFSLDDGSSQRRHVLIDENDKVFRTTLSPLEEGSITIVFPIDVNDTYTLYYSESAKDEDSITWTLDNNNLERKKVEPTLEHELETEPLIDKTAEAEEN